MVKFTLCNGEAGCGKMTKTIVGTDWAIPGMCDECGAIKNPGGSD